MERQFMDEEDLKVLWANVLKVAVPKPTKDQAGYVLTVNKEGGFEWARPTTITTPSDSKTTEG